MQYSLPYTRVSLMCSAITLGVVSYAHRLGPLAIALVILLGSFPLHIVFISLLSLVLPPKLKRADLRPRAVRIRDGDVSLGLKDKPPR